MRFWETPPTPREKRIRAYLGAPASLRAVLRQEFSDVADEAEARELHDKNTGFLRGILNQGAIK